MKKDKKCVGLLLMLVICLAACGNTAEEAAAREGEVMPEASANDLLVDSLEYLLKEEQEGIKEELTVRQNISEEETQQPEVEVAIYYGNGASEKLNMEMSSMEQVTAENLIDALVRHNIVSLGTKVNSFEEREENGVKTLHLDLSKTFHEYLKTMTKEGENVILSSMAATFLSAYNAENMVITIDGSVLETENAVYEEPLQCRPEHMLKQGK